MESTKPYRSNYQRVLANDIVHIFVELQMLAIVLCSALAIIVPYYFWSISFLWTAPGVLVVSCYLLYYIYDGWNRWHVKHNA